MNKKNGKVVLVIIVIALLVVLAWWWQQQSTKSVNETGGVSGFGVASAPGDDGFWDLCTVHDNRFRCESDPNCKYDPTGGSCVPPSSNICGSSTTPSGCAMSFGCIWDYSGHVCKSKCTNQSNENDCIRQYSPCKWTGGTCSSKVGGVVVAGTAEFFINSQMKIRPKGCIFGANPK